MGFYVGTMGNYLNPGNSGFAGIRNDIYVDEAHLLFDSASKSLLRKIEQVVKLIRSKGVGIYFITQSPKDIPDGVLGQLGNKIQHALHAYTPSEQKAVKAAAQSFRENPDFDTVEALTSLESVEALVSVLDESGIPTIVKKCRILPPQSRMGTITEEERKEEIEGSLLYNRYFQTVDRESAYEILEKKVLAEKEDEEKAEAQSKRVKSAMKQTAGSAVGTIGREVGNSVGKSLGCSFGKKIGGNVGASLGRGILNTLFKL